MDAGASADEWWASNVGDFLEICRRQRHRWRRERTRACWPRGLTRAERNKRSKSKKERAKVAAQEGEWQEEEEVNTGEYQVSTYPNQ